MDFRSDRGSVDVGYARLEIAYRFECAVHISRVNGGRKTVGYAVGDFERIFEIFGGNHRDHGAENFFLRNTHISVRIAEDRGLEKVTVAQPSGCEPISSCKQLRALASSDIDVFASRLDLLLVDLRTHIVPLIDAGADFQCSRSSNELISELVIYALLHDHAARRCASLSCCAEAAPKRSVDGEIDIGVVQNDDRVLATHLK